MLKVDYKLSIADWSVDSSADRRTELVALDVLSEMNSPVGHVEVTAYAPAPASPGALEQLAGAAASAAGLLSDAAPVPSGRIRGHEVQGGDPVSVELSVGGLSGRVGTAKVHSLSASLELLTVTGRTGMQRLAETRVNQIYENQSLGQVARDLAGRAGVDAGDVETGSTYPYLALHESRSVLRTLLSLAALEGMDVYFDEQDRLVVKRFAKTRGDHVFRYGSEILNLAVRKGEPVTSRTVVHGESPASSTGSDTWHWLVADRSAYTGESGEGDRVRALQNGAVRTKAAADAAAQAGLAAARTRATTARLTVLGRPTLRLGDAIELSGVPGDAISGVLKIGSVRHVFNEREGYVTVLGLSVPAGAGGPAAGVGQALGAVL